MMFYQSNNAWLTAPLATLMVVAVDQITRHLDAAAAWAAMARAWLFQTAVMVGTFSTALLFGLTGAAVGWIANSSTASTLS